MPTPTNNYLASLNRWTGYKFQLQDFGKPFLPVTTTAGTSNFTPASARSNAGGFR